MYRSRGFILTLLILLLSAFLLATVGLGLYVLKLDDTVRTKFEGKRWAIPARVYARPLELYEGASLSVGEVQQELRLLNYREQADTGPGTWQRQGDTLTIHTRGFAFPDGTEKSQVVRLDFSGNQVSKVRSTVPATEEVLRLEPLVIGGIYPRQNEDRVLMQLKEAPPYLLEALMATEDRSFYKHHGISFRGIARALWVNVSGGGLQQGGSTLTQQLVKNFYLNSERTLSRKLNEAAMAVLLEIHYSKEEILEAYLNEVALGQSGDRSVNGFGLASQFFFGQPISELNLSQVALLVGMVQGPSYYNPRRNPERAKSRRNLVIDNLLATGKISPEEAAAAKKKPLNVLPKPAASTTVYPAFMDMVRRQLREEYKDEDLSSEGLRIFTTVDPQVQNASQAAFDMHIAHLRKSGNKRQANVQGAMAVSTPENGEVLALIGGAEGFTGYNRALDAKRQIGSLIKPAVYLSALDTGRYTLVTPLDDGPVTLQGSDGKIWEPKNDDGESHGIVPFYVGLSRSYNQATIRMGMDVGIPQIINTLKQVGVSQKLQPYPSLMLGAVDMSPVDVLSLYQVFASGGFGSSLRTIRSVVDAQNKPLTRHRIDIRQTANPTSVYLVNYALQQTMRSGTAASAYKVLPNDLVIAGKTGTTNDLRDAWFAGYAGNYLAVVWVGNDDNKPTGLFGATGALPIWTETMRRLNPRSKQLAAPDNIEWHWADYASGLLSAEHCPGAVFVPFRIDTIPQESIACAQEDGGILQGLFNRVKGWL